MDLEYTTHLDDFGIARMVDLTILYDLSSVVSPTQPVGLHPQSEELDLSIHGYAGNGLAMDSEFFLIVGSCK